MSIAGTPYMHERHLETVQWRLHQMQRVALW